MSILHPNSITGLALQPPRRAVGLHAAAWTSRLGTGTTVLLLGDLASLIVGAIVSILIWHRFSTTFSTGLYARLWPILLLFPAAYAAAGLYPGFGRNPVEELRRLCAATSVVYAALAVSLFLLKDAASYSRAVFLLAWVQSLAAVPLSRALVRYAFARRSWWGDPVAIIGAGPAPFALADTLAERVELGLKPILVLDAITGVRADIESHGIRHAILVASPEINLPKMFRELSARFPRVTVVPDLAGLASLWVEARDFGGIIGLEVRQRLLAPGARILKRWLDIALVLTLGIAALPFILVIAALVKLSSPGPVFYGQRRCGRHGHTFLAWKFRSMVVNASEVLDACLASDPALLAEWRGRHKLKNDPRITRLGRFLRRTSLDELPQLWNVLLGEMSLVGPRPIVAAEIARYGEAFSVYQQVLPGLTGLWQVSGRNMLSYQQRVSLDQYYARNWSPWLDIYILARTVTAVLQGRGAY